MKITKTEPVTRMRMSKLLKKIHVNQHNIKHNIKSKEKRPVLTVKTYKENHTCNQVEILDAQGDVAAVLQYSPDKPLSCGARVWIETRNGVRTDNGR